MRFAALRPYLIQGEPRPRRDTPECERRGTYVAGAYPDSEADAIVERVRFRQGLDLLSGEGAGDGAVYKELDGLE